MEDLEFILDRYGDLETYERAQKIREEELLNKRKPNKADIRETKRLFRDFGIKGAVIPELPTYNALVRWRRDHIVKALDSMED